MGKLALPEQLGCSGMQGVAEFRQFLRPERNHDSGGRHEAKRQRFQPMFDSKFPKGVACSCARQPTLDWSCRESQPEDNRGWKGGFGSVSEETAGILSIVIRTRHSGNSWSPNSSRIGSSAKSVGQSYVDLGVPSCVFKDLPRYALERHL